MFNILRYLNKSAFSIYLVKERSGCKNQIKIQCSVYNIADTMCFDLASDQVSNGGAKQDRTADLLRARQALSQLSYSPIILSNVKLVGLGRLELPTSPLSGVRSNQLSYKPSKSGGAKQDRTADLLNANQALSQLSYSPI